jgi:RHS repeat-associated protein
VLKGVLLIRNAIYALLTFAVLASASKVCASIPKTGNDFSTPWDAENRLIAVNPVNPVNNPTSVLFTYDSQNRRTRKQVYHFSGGTWNLSTDACFTYDDWNLIAETTANQDLGVTIQTFFVWGADRDGKVSAQSGTAQLLCVITSTNSQQPTVYYPVCNEHGDITALFDSTGTQIVAKYERDPWGVLLSASGPAAGVCPFGFQTKYTDAETGLVNFGRRFYSPTLGRFISRDPKQEEGGFNFYSYGNANPFEIDQLGLKFFGTATDVMSGGVEDAGVWTSTHWGCAAGTLVRTVGTVGAGMLSSVDSLVLAPVERLVTTKPSVETPQNIPIVGPVVGGLAGSYGHVAGNPCSIENWCGAVGNTAGAALTILVPVKMGGAAGAATTSAETETAAQMLRSKALSAERNITSEIMETAKTTDGRMAGLENRIKTLESLTRKVQNVPASQITDALRYTLIFGQNEFASSVLVAIARLRSLGYEIVSIKNTFVNGLPYKGINVVVRAKSGQVFELQFHTETSLAVKAINHSLYERWRVMPGDTEASQAILEEMVRNSETIPNPAGVNAIRK